jgi:hypothetical protein
MAILLRDEEVGRESNKVKARSKNRTGRRPIMAGETAIAMAAKTRRGIMSGSFAGGASLFRRKQ